MPRRASHRQAFRYFKMGAKTTVKTMSNTTLNELNTILNKYIVNLSIEFLQDLADEILSDAQSRLTGDKELENTTDPNGGAFDTGRLHASGDWVMINDETIEVGFEAPYAGDVEFGMTPSQVEVTYEEILAWARRKRIRNPKKAAFFIHKNLHEFGLKPRPYLRAATAWGKANTDKVARRTQKRLNLPS